MMIIMLIMTLVGLQHKMTILLFRWLSSWGLDLSSEKKLRAVADKQARQVIIPITFNTKCYVYYL